jgi:DNA-binding response OmpR family regulator
MCYTVQEFSERGLGMAKILLIEDDKIIQKIMKVRLKMDGHDVLLADDGIDGVAMAQSEKPDIILMDMLLPRLNGWLAAEQIKVVSDVPIIALTGAAAAADKQKMLDAGCSDYVIKPVNFNELAAKINTLLV